MFHNSSAPSFGTVRSTLRPILQNNENVLSSNNVKQLKEINSQHSSTNHPSIHKPGSHKTPKANSTKKRRALGDISNRSNTKSNGGKAILLQKNGNTVSKKGFGGNALSTKKTIARKSKLSLSQSSKSVSFALFEDTNGGTTANVKKPPQRTELNIHLDSKPKESVRNQHDEVEDIEVLAGRSYIEEQEYFDNEPIHSLGVDESIIFPVVEEHFRKKHKERERKIIKEQEEKMRIADAKFEAELEKTIRQIGINDAIDVAEHMSSPCSILDANYMEEINFDDGDSLDEYFSKRTSEIDISDLAL